MSEEKTKMFVQFYRKILIWETGRQMSFCSGDALGDLSLGTMHLLL